MIRTPLLSALLLTAALPAAAQEWDFTAAISGEVRVFPNDPLYPAQFETWQPSVAIEPELRYDSDRRTHQFVLKPFLRIDGQDDERTHVDLREGYYRYNADAGWSLTAGAVKVFWGRTESRHLVDIINQIDAVEDVDEEDKLGQPMVNLTLRQEWGTVDLFVMTGFRDRTFPGTEGRPRFPLPVDTDDPVFTRDDGREAIDLAARYSHYIGNWDFGVSAFHGTSREPRFAIAADGQSLRPVYDEITQAGLDVQYTRDAWLWKLEAILREGHGDSFAAAVGGFEYTLYGISGSGADLGLLAEYQYDGRDEGTEIEAFGPVNAAPFTLADNDVFVGARLAFNDIQDTAILAGMTNDTEDGSKTVLFEASRRLGENWTGDIEARIFTDIDADNPAFAFREDDFVTFRLTRYF
jgi:hypothetical protein